MVFLDDDTRVEDSEFLARVHRLFESEPDTAVVAFRILDPATGRSRSFEIPGRNKVEPSAWVTFPLLLPRRSVA